MRFPAHSGGRRSSLGGRWPFVGPMRCATVQPGAAEERQRANRKPGHALDSFYEFDTQASITSPRSVAACQSEGVLPEELIYQPRDIFVAPGVPLQVSQLRHDFIEARRQDLLTACRRARHAMVAQAGGGSSSRVATGSLLASPTPPCAALVSFFRAKHAEFSGHNQSKMRAGSESPGMAMSVSPNGAATASPSSPLSSHCAPAASLSSPSVPEAAEASPSPCAAATAAGAAAPGSSGGAEEAVRSREGGADAGSADGVGWNAEKSSELDYPGMVATKEDHGSSSPTPVEGHADASSPTQVEGHVDAPGANLRQAHSEPAIKGLINQLSNAPGSGYVEEEMTRNGLAKLVAQPRLEARKRLKAHTTQKVLVERRSEAADRWLIGLCLERDEERDAKLFRDQMAYRSMNIDPTENPQRELTRDNVFRVLLRLDQRRNEALKAIVERDQDLEKRLAEERLAKRVKFATDSLEDRLRWRWNYDEALRAKGQKEEEKLASLRTREDSYKKWCQRGDNCTGMREELKNLREANRRMIQEQGRRKEEYQQRQKQMKRFHSSPNLMR